MRGVLWVRWRDWGFKGARRKIATRRNFPRNFSYSRGRETSRKHESDNRPIDSISSFKKQKAVIKVAALLNFSVVGDFFYFSYNFTTQRY